jgi:chemotaxis signal transduction protein
VSTKRHERDSTVDLKLDRYSAVQSHLLTRVDDFDLAIPIESIVSVHEAPLVVPVPAAQQGILGAVRVRAQALPVFDIRRSLRLNSKPVEYDDRLIVVRSRGRHIGMIVDAVLTLVDVPPGVLQGPDPLFGDTPVNGQVITGIAAAPELCAVVDPDGLILPDPWEDDEAQDLFAAEIPTDHPLGPRTAALAETLEATEIVGTDAAVFVLAGQRYAVPVGNVAEFFNASEYSPLPVPSNISASLVNRRGEAIPLYDVRPLLGLTGQPLPAHVDGVVLAGNGFRMAIAVDSFDGLEVLPTAASSGTRPGRYCLSIHASPRGPIQLLDVAALTAAPQFSLSGEGST